MSKTNTFKDVFDVAKNRIANNKLSLNELSENAIVPEELLRILFDNRNNIVNDISRLFEFLNIRVSATEKAFKVYRITDDGQQLKITRVIKPLCSMYYDKGDGKFYRFSYKIKREKRDKSETDIIKTEIKELVINHLNNI